MKVRSFSENPKQTAGQKQQQNHSGRVLSFLGSPFPVMILKQRESILGAKPRVNPKTLILNLTVKTTRLMKIVPQIVNQIQKQD
jgi:hypothetical protein